MSAARNILFSIFARKSSDVDGAKVVAELQNWLSTQDYDLRTQLTQLGIIDPIEADALDALVTSSILSHGGNMDRALQQELQSDNALQELRRTYHHDPSAVTTAGGAKTKNQPVEHVPGERPNAYQELSEIGRGGMGRVSIVRDIHLRREIALKELVDDADRPDADPYSEYLSARFLREARITARLDHPGIVPIHEVGQRADGTLYYTMKAVNGDTLAARIEQKSTLAERLTLFDHYVDLCQAVAYAHNRGVIHRDIKTENVMIGKYGETVIIDWGIAKYIDDPEEDAPNVDFRNDDPNPDTTPLTAYGATMGTPTFMAPEAALGQSDRVGTASDVYSLGVVLYALLTGRLPFCSDSLTELKAKVIASEPAPLRQIDSGIAPELEAICLRALAKDPDERYNTAQDLLDEINRYRSGKLVDTYHYHWLDHTRRFVRQHASEISIALIATVVLAVLSAGAILVVLRANAAERAARIKAEEQTIVADRRSAESRYQDYARGILQAQALLREHEFALAIDALESLPVEYRNWEWGHLYLSAHPNLTRLKGHTGPIKDIRFSGDATLALSASADGSVIAWDWNSATPKQRLSSSKKPYKLAAFSNKDARILAVTEARDFEIWNAQTTQLEASILGVPNQPHALVVSADDRFAVVRTKHAASMVDLESGAVRKTLHPNLEQTARIAIRSRDGVLIAQYENELVREWHPESGDVIRTIDLRGDGFPAVRLSDDGEFLMARRDDGETVAFDLETMDIITRFEGSPMRNWRYAFSHENAYIADSSVRGFLGVWRTSDGRKIWDTDETRSRPREIVFGPHNRHIAMVTDDNIVRIWNFQEGRQTAVYTPPDENYSKIVFAPDGTRLLAGTREGDIFVYPVNRSDEGRVVGDRSGEQDRSKRLSGLFKDVRFITNDTIAIELDARRPSFINAFTGAKTDLRTVPLGLGPIAYASNSDYLLYGGKDSRAHLLHNTTNTTTPLDLFAPELRAATFNRDGTQLLTVSKGGDVLIWDVANPAHSHRISIPNTIAYDAAFTNEPDRFLITDGNSEICIWDVGRQHKIFEVQIPRPLTSPPVVSYRLRTVLAVSNDYMLRAWNIDDGSLRWERKAWYEHDAALPIHPDGESIALTTRKGLELLHISDGGSIITFGKQESEAVDFAFHPTADRAASCAQDGKLRIWDTKHGTQLMTTGHNNAYMASVEFDHDGKRLLVGLDNGQAIIMDSLHWNDSPASDSTLEDNLDRLKAETYKNWVSTHGTPSIVPRESEGPPLLLTNFDRPSTLDKWSDTLGWRIEQGRLTAERTRGTYEFVAIVAPPINSSRYAVEVDVTMEEGERFLIAVGSRTNESTSSISHRFDAYVFGLDRIITDKRELFPHAKVYKGNGHNVFWANVPKDLITAYGPNLARFPWRHRNFFRLRVEVDRQELRAFIDNEYIGGYTAPTPIQGRFGFAHVLGDNIPSAKYDSLVIRRLP